MKIIKSPGSIQENWTALESIIRSFVERLNSDPIKNRQKIVEVCHTGKFLMLLGNGGRIEQLTESPDFVININDELVGLEHQVVIDSESKEREGFYENIFSIAESELQMDNEIPNFHANCFLKDNSIFELKKKTNLIQEVKAVVKHFIKTNELLQNSLIEEIDSMPHTQKSISPNFGAWWQKEMTNEVLISAISRKESKIEDYIRNHGKKQWLLLVIGGLNKSSYEMAGKIDFEVNSKFDKIYLLEDFRARLFEIK